MFLNELQIQNYKHLIGDMYQLSVESKMLSEHSKPGQFLGFKNTLQSLPYLRSVHVIGDFYDNVLDIVFVQQSSLHTMLNNLKNQLYLSCQGPLGRGFCINSSIRLAVLIMTKQHFLPLRWLSLYFQRNTIPYEIICLDEIREEQEASASYSVDEIEFLFQKKIYVINSMSKNTLKYNLENQIADKMLHEGSIVFGCASQPFSHTLAEICVHNAWKSEWFIDQFIPCGFGVCLGCPVLTKNGYDRGCVEGPVFPAEVLCHTMSNC